MINNFPKRKTHKFTPVWNFIFSNAAFHTAFISSCHPSSTCFIKKTAIWATGRTHCGGPKR